MVVGGLASFADYALDLPTLPVQINPGDEFLLASRTYDFGFTAFYRPIVSFTRRLHAAPWPLQRGVTGG